MEEDLSQWKGVSLPQRKIIEGRFVRLVPMIAAEHGDALFDMTTDEAVKNMRKSRGSREEFLSWLRSVEDSKDHVVHAVVEVKTAQVLGRQMFFEMNLQDGVVELGGVLRSNQLSRQPGSTEAIYLSLHHVFDELGYRRVEWRCFNSNEASKRAAVRLGFTFEGILRCHLVVRGGSKDTCVYSMIRSEWLALKQAYLKWLHPDNFDSTGIQKVKLEEFRSQ